MLKKRIIPLLLYKDGRLVKTVKFSSSKDVGHPAKSAQIYSDQDADELVILKIDDNNFDEFLKTIEILAKTCFVPLSVGGGIRTMGMTKKLFAAGADKIVLNSLLYTDQNLVREMISIYGSQAVIACIDVKKNRGHFDLFSNNGRNFENVSLQKHIENLNDLGVGEILLQSMDRDGMMKGYELGLFQEIQSFKSPLIIAGGAGNFLDLKNAFDCGFDAVACGSLFNFGDNNPLRAKAYLKNFQIPLKLI